MRNRWISRLAVLLLGGAAVAALTLPSVAGPGGLAGHMWDDVTVAGHTWGGVIPIG